MIRMNWSGPCRQCGSAIPASSCRRRDGESLWSRTFMGDFIACGQTTGVRLARVATSGVDRIAADFRDRPSESLSASGIGGKSKPRPPHNTYDQPHKQEPSGGGNVGYRSVTSADGTRLRAWDNEGHGAPVVISNGLGTPHDAWPDINRRTDRYRVMTWDQRGLGGSDRPADESRITIADHTDDLFAVMDSYGVERAVVIGWSAGVNVAFEAALRHPKRIAGVLAIAGVPGGTFEALLHPLPRFLRPPAGRVGSHLMRYLGPVLNRIGDGLPGSPEHGFDPRGVGTIGLDLVHGDILLRVLRRFANHDWPWYSRLARAVGDHAPMDLSAIDMPVTYLAGTWDAITSAESMRAASKITPRSQYVELAATHFVPLQFPHRMSTELDRLINRCRL
jgi:3-oxoadipate enol-lactonase